MSVYLGVKMNIDEEKAQIRMTHPFLIERIFGLFGDATKDSNTKETPAVYKEVLTKDKNGPDR